VSLKQATTDLWTVGKKDSAATAAVVVVIEDLVGHSV